MDQKLKHYWIYVLELKNGKYYVGMTTQRNAEGRIKQHQSGFYSAKWVKKHGYKDTLQVHDLGLVSKVEAEKTESILTRDLMDQHGRDNVRGGDLVYEGKYVYRFGRFHTDENWKNIIGISFMMFVIVVLTLGYLYEKYLV